MHTVTSIQMIQSGQQYLNLDYVLGQAVKKLTIDAIALYLRNRAGSLTFLQGRGFTSEEIKYVIGNPVAKNTRSKILSRSNSVITNIQLDQPKGTAKIKSTSLHPLIKYQASPIILSGEAKGVIEVYSRESDGIKVSDGEAFDMVTQKISSALDRTGQSDHFSPTLGTNPPKHSATLDALMAAMLLRSGEIVSHARRVTDMTLHLAKTFGLADDQMVHLVRGAMLHDIGKLAIPDSILQKPGALSRSEWDLMRKHPEFAFKLLSPIASLKKALPIPYSHHERWDGSGYPLGLKGDAIPLAARLFSIVDVWDALRSDRPYRKAWLDHDVQYYILKQSGKQFDPQVTEVFLDLI